jgi:hypothetical protein
MATSFVWKIQDSATMTPADVTVDGGTMGDLIQFANGTFGSSIAVGSYNTSTHVESSAGADDTMSITPRNSRFINANSVKINAQATEALGTMITTMDAPLTILHSVTSASVTIMSAKFWAHKGGMTATVPTGVDFRCYEANASGGTTWTEAEAFSMALALDNQASSSMTHSFFLLISASPTTVGVHAGTAAATGGQFVFTMKLRYT